MVVIVENLVSICIPTCNRPGLLLKAIESCYEQIYRPIEILIGDDSKNDSTEQLVSTLIPPPGVEVHYQHNDPALSQFGNVNLLFDTASGSRLLLLHDDDLLCTGGLDLLIDGWANFPGTRCIYGKQYVIDEGGNILLQHSQSLNNDYFRRDQDAGRQSSALRVCLKQQMPNNCYLIETALAQQVRCRSEDQIGTSVDADFGIRAGLAVSSGSFVFINEFVSKYRLTKTSIMRAKNVNNARHLLFSYVKSLPLSQDDEPARHILLVRIAPQACLNAAMSRQKMLALRILVGKHYRHSLLSKATIFRLLYILSSRLGSQASRLMHR